MRDIYSHAHRVAIYLGEQADGSEILPLLFHQIYVAGAKFGTLKPGLKFPQPKIISPSRYEELGLPPRNSPVWEVIRYFLNRPWFRRIWIIQEAVVSNRAEVMCGEWSLPWKLFTDIFQIAIVNEMGILGGIEDDDERAAAVRLLWFMIVLRPRDSLFKPQWKLIHLLHRCRVASATDARDYIFGLLGLSSEANEYDLRPDYTQNLEQVYCRVAEYFVKHGDGISLLYDSGKTSNKGLPSWVPNWASKDVAYPRLCPEPRLDPKAVECKYYAATNLKPFISLHESRPGILVVRGIQFDSIKALGSIWRSDPPQVPALTARVNAKFPGETNHDNFKRKMGITSLHDNLLVGDCIKALHKILGQQGRYPTGEEISTVLWQTAVCNGLVKSGPPLDEKCFRAFSLIVSAMDKSWLWPRLAISMSEMQNPGKLVEEAGSFLRDAREFCCSRRRAVSSQGYAAQVPLSTQVGDLIFLPLGSAVPFVLRLSESGRDEFELIGECYAHGIMKGEAVGEKLDVVDIHML
jgi:hypothetical protein